MIYLAPMAGISDAAFRHLCYEYGCDRAFCEMVSANALAFDSIQTKALMTKAENEPDLCVQIFGGDPGLMAEMAAQIVQECSAKVIDINMGCPVPKVVKNGYGCALMNQEKRAGEILKQVSRAVKVPVTVKIRKGFERDNAVEFALLCQENGASALTVHGRTARQLYHGAADWEVIARVRRALAIPVIANGDIKSYEDAQKIREVTGCQDVMVARGALGQPYLFRQIKQALEGAPPLLPSPKERIDIALRHLELACRYQGEQRALLQMRKHLGWYLSGMKQATRVRAQINRCTQKEELLELLTGFQICL